MFRLYLILILKRNIVNLLYIFENTIIVSNNFMSVYINHLKSKFNYFLNEIYFVFQMYFLSQFHSEIRVLMALILLANFLVPSVLAENKNK